MAKYKAEHVGKDTTVKKSPCGKYEKWIPARPDNHKYESVSTRVQHAWGVLTGKYDALDWDDN